MSDRTDLATLQIRSWPGKDSRTDCVAVEEPLEIRLGWGPISERRQQPVAVTMRTPGTDPELAAGFLYSEGIIRAPEDIRSVGPCEAGSGEDPGQIIRVELEPGVTVDLARLERHFYTTSSCGVCGKQALEALRFQTIWSPAESPFRISSDALTRLPRKLRSGQPLFRETGSIHAAALFDAAGEISASFEDVGRHNALDKLVGATLREGRLPLAERGILVSGRASFELIQKAVMAGCPMLAAIGGPSSLAVAAAADFGVTLVGFLGAERFNVYSRPERVIP